MHTHTRKREREREELVGHTHEHIRSTRVGLEQTPVIASSGSGQGKHITHTTAAVRMFLALAGGWNKLLS